MPGTRGEGKRREKGGEKEELRNPVATMQGVYESAITKRKREIKKKGGGEKKGGKKRLAKLFYNKDTVHFRIHEYSRPWCPASEAQAEGGGTKKRRGGGGGKREGKEKRKGFHAVTICISAIRSCRLHGWRRAGRKEEKKKERKRGKKKKLSRAI